MRSLLSILLSCALLSGAPVRAAAQPGDQEPVAAEPAARPAFDQVAAVGLVGEPHSTTWTVTAVARGSAAYRAGFETGDVIGGVAEGRPAGEYVTAVAAALGAARAAGERAADLDVRLRRAGKERTMRLVLPLGEIDVLVATTRALDYLADEVNADPRFEKTRTRSFYAPIIDAPLTGLALLTGGSTRRTGRHAAALRVVLAYCMEHGGRRKHTQDAINEAVGGNICSLTHNAGFNAMFLAQLIGSEAPERAEGGGAEAEGAGTSLRFSQQQIRDKLRACCKTLEGIQLKNGGWQHGSGGVNMLGYTDLVAATVTAMNGLAMARQVGVDESGPAIERGLDYLRRVTEDGRVGYAAGNRGTFSPGRNAAVLQVMVRLGLAEDDLVGPMKAILATKIDEAGMGHGSPVWHLFYVGLATAHLLPEARAQFDAPDRHGTSRAQRPAPAALRLRQAPRVIATRPASAPMGRPDRATRPDPPAAPRGGAPSRFPRVDEAGAANATHDGVIERTQHGPRAARARNLRSRACATLQPTVRSHVA